MKRSLSTESNNASPDRDIVKVTHHRQNDTLKPSLSVCDLDREAATKLVDDLLVYTRSLMGKNVPQHLIAFSGGVDSSLAAALVFQSSKMVHDENVKAVLGISPAVPAEQVDLAERVARQIGIELEQVQTAEGDDETYLANAGRACLACKTHLYSTLQAIVQKQHSGSESSEQHRNRRSDDASSSFCLYNGTNADDVQDETRLGLVAAREFDVKSPLRHVTKPAVRRAARHLGLLNWNYAASPCLRSRLALGVTATAQHLQLMAQAERLVRQRLSSSLSLSTRTTNGNVLDETTNLRVRLLAGNKARIEIDEPLVDATTAQDWEDLRSLGDFSSVSVRAFRSGAVARRTTEEPQIAAADEETIAVG